MLRLLRKDLTEPPDSIMSSVVEVAVTMEGVVATNGVNGAPRRQPELGLVVSPSNPPKLTMG